MKKTVVLGMLMVGFMVATSDAFAAIKWVSSSHSSRGGYYCDTSNDGNPYNNANYLGYND